MRVVRGVIAAFVLYIVVMFAVPFVDPMLMIVVWGALLGLLFAVPSSRRLIIGRKGA